MNISLFTIINSIIFTIILIVSLLVFLKYKSILLNCSPTILIVVLSFPFVRLLVAVEFPLSFEIISDIVYPAIYNIFKQEVFCILSSSFTLAHILIVVWLIGAFYHIALEIHSYRSIIYSFRHFKILKNTKETLAVELILKNSGVNNRDNISIIKTSCVTEPMIYGLYRPIIVLPDYKFTDSEMNQILSHEIAHLLNHDILAKWILEIVCSFYWWFYPVKQLKQSIYNIMEIRADQQVIKNSTRIERLSYLQLLLKICKLKSLSISNNHFAFFSFGDNETMKLRFEIIAKYQKNKRKSYDSAILCFFIFLITFSFLFILQPEYSIPEEDVTFEISTESAVQYYIITNSNGGFDLYNIDGSYWGWMSEIPEEFKNISIQKGVVK